MKKIQIILLSLFVLPFIAFAASPQHINLNKYFQAKCSDYTGTWQGFFTDPTNLFGNGGPWPVTLSVYNKDDKIIGRVQSRKAPDYVSATMKGRIWANCTKGKLSNIFLGDPNQCGSYSQKGLLVSRNVLVLQLNYENAMIGTSFLLFLERVNRRYHAAIPSNIKDMTIAAPKRCH